MLSRISLFAILSVFFVSSESNLVSWDARELQNNGTINSYIGLKMDDNLRDDTALDFKRLGKINILIIRVHFRPLIS